MVKDCWEVNPGRPTSRNPINTSRFEATLKMFPSETNFKLWSIKKEWKEFAKLYHQSKTTTDKHARRLYDFYRQSPEITQIKTSTQTKRGSSEVDINDCNKNMENAEKRYDCAYEALNEDQMCKRRKIEMGGIKIIDNMIEKEELQTRADHAQNTETDGNMLARDGVEYVKETDATKEHKGIKGEVKLNKTTSQSTVRQKQRTINSKRGRKCDMIADKEMTSTDKRKKNKPYLQQHSATQMISEEENSEDSKAKSRFEDAYKYVNWEDEVYKSRNMVKDMESENTNVEKESGENYSFAEEKLIKNEGVCEYNHDKEDEKVKFINSTDVGNLMNKMNKKIERRITAKKGLSTLQDNCRQCNKYENSDNKCEKIKDILTSVCAGIVSSAIDKLLSNSSGNNAIKDRGNDLLNVEQAPRIIDNAQDDSIFEDIGIDHDTAESLAECKLPRAETFHEFMDGVHFESKVTENWFKIPIIDKENYRHLGGDWVKHCLSHIKKKNPYCVWKFTSNFVKKKDSRKSNCQFFNAKAQCIHRDCPCKVKIIQQHENDCTLLIQFTGDVHHLVTNPKSRQIKGKEREDEKKKFQGNSSINPSDVYRKKLGSLPGNAFATGNREGVGNSKKVYQNIKNEAMHEINSFENLHKQLIDLQIKLEKEDEKQCLNNGLMFRKLFGYIHSIIVTNHELKVVLLEERSIILFHNLASKDIVYLDATGGIVKKLTPYNKIFLYSLALRHPFGKTFPVPAALYITNVHTTDSVRFMLMSMREKERFLFGNTVEMVNIYLILGSFYSFRMVSFLCFWWKLSSL